MEAKYYPSNEEKEKRGGGLVGMKDRAEKYYKNVLREINTELDNFAKKVKKNQP